MNKLTRRFTACRRATLTVAALPALMLIGLAGPGVLRAQDDKLPTGEAILDKYVEVTGGQAAYGKLNNRVAKLTIDLPAQGLKFPTTIYAAKPNKMYTLMESEAFGKMEKGTDGDVVWEMNVMTGPQIKEGEERALARRGAVFDAVPNWRKVFKKAECVGVETVADQLCYKVVLTANEGEPETRYFSKETHLLVKSELKLKLPAGTIPIEAYPSDYKRVDGILIAHKTRVVAMGSERIMTTENVEHNVKLAKDRFKLPEEIQALVKSKKSQDDAGKPDAEKP